MIAGHPALGQRHHRRRRRKPGRRREGGGSARRRARHAAPPSAEPRRGRRDANGVRGSAAPRSRHRREDGRRRPDGPGVPAGAASSRSSTARRHGEGQPLPRLPALRDMPAVRVVGNAGLTFLVKLASGYWNLFDPANGYLAVTTSLLERISLDSLPDRYYFECGLLVELGMLGAVVKDVPMPARYGEASSLSVTRALIGFPPRLDDGARAAILLALPRARLHGGVGVRAPRAAVLPLRRHLRDRALHPARAIGAFASAGTVMIAAMPILLGVVLLAGDRARHPGRAEGAAHDAASEGTPRRRAPRGRALRTGPVTPSPS